MVSAGWGSLGSFRYDGTHAKLRLARGEVSVSRFTFRNPDRASAPRVEHGWATHYISFALGYPGHPDGARLAVAAYAGEGSYGRLSALLGELAKKVSGAGVRALPIFDSNALFDRALARRAGIGLVGRHTLIMVKGYGAKVVLGHLLTAEAVPLRIGPKFRGNPCRSCRRCIDACPTGALRFPGELVERLCIASILQRETIAPEERGLVGSRIYGCDTCIDACPIGRRQLVEGTPQAAPEVMALSGPEVLAKFSQWYIPRRDPFYLKRNFLIALANSGPLTWSERLAVARLLFDLDPRLRAEALICILKMRWVANAASSGN